jgi:hypothetical protein
MRRSARPRRCVRSGLHRVSLPSAGPRSSSPGLAAATEIDEILVISRSNQKFVDLAASGPVCVRVVVGYTYAEQGPACGPVSVQVAVAYTYAEQRVAQGL